MKEGDFMKKTIVCRSLLGLPMGIAISYSITVMISALLADGNYYPVVPELAAKTTSELDAVLIQLLCSAVYGAVFGGASVIWEAESWSLLRMTLTHLTVISISSLPIAWFLEWMPHTALGVVIYFAIFYGIYAIVWLSQYSVMKKRVRQMNAQLDRNTSE